MGRFTKKLAVGLTASMLLAGSAFAQVSSTLDNFEGGTNQNMFGDYWYFYNDQEIVSPITIENGKSGTTVITTGTAEGSEIKFDENSITTTNARGNNSGQMGFKFGQTFLMPYGAAVNTCPQDGPNWSNTIYGTGNEGGCYLMQQLAGIGTNIVADGQTTSPAGFSSATKITFWARAASPMSVSFRVLMSHITDDAYYEIIFPITAAWAEYEVPLNGTDMQPPGWGPATPHQFIKTNIVKIAWQVQANDSQGAYPLNPTADEAADYTNTLVLDDIVIHDFNFVAADLCVNCVGNPRPSQVTLLANFEENTMSTLDYYWYAYTDNATVVDAGSLPGSTVITDGCDYDSPNALDGGCELLITEDGDAKYVMIAFEMGNTMTIGGNRVQPFVGLGTNLYDDELNDGFFDAVAAGVNGIYFKYLTGENKVTVEVMDQLDVTGGRPESAVRYIDLPPTNNQWVEAIVPFDTLKLHMEWADVSEWAAANPPAVALRRNALAKIQIKYQGGSNAHIAVDDVYWVGGTSSIRHVTSRARTAGIRATYNRGTIGVNWDAASTVSSGRVMLVNTMGRVVASAPIANASGNRVSANLGSRIPTGMYFVRIDARDVNGKRIVQQAPISVVR